MTTRNRKIRRTAALAAAGVVVTLAGCSSTPAPTTTSTTSTTTYAQTINGGNDPAYATGFTAVKNFITVQTSDPTSSKLPAEASKYGTAEFVAATQAASDSFWKTLKGGPVGRFEDNVVVSEWRGVVLNRNTQQMPWHMELGVCTTATAKVTNKSGALILSGSQIRLSRYTLTSPDQGKTWLVSQQQFVPSQVPQSKYDPRCVGNLNSDGQSPSAPSAHTS